MIYGDWLWFMVFVVVYNEEIVIVDCLMVLLVMIYLCDWLMIILVNDCLIDNMCVLIDEVCVFVFELI